MTTPWLSRGDPGQPSGLDDAGTIVREARLASGRKQVDVAKAAGLTQQHLSQIEKNQRPVSIEQRLQLSAVLDIPPEDLGLAAVRPRPARSAANDPRELAVSRGRWRSERTWLNQHRSDLAKLAVAIYPPECRIPRTPLVSAAGWIPSAPIPLRTLALSLNETPLTSAVTGKEPETEAVRPLRTPSVRFDSYTTAIKHLSPPALFESRPSYRLMGASVLDRKLRFGLATYFDKLDVSEALGHEMALICMNEGIPTSPAALQGKLPFRELIGDPFDTSRRAVIPAITTLTLRLRRYPAEPSFLLHWRDPAKVATAGGMYDVIPAGEFQPSSVALWDRHNDFDLWRNIVREYSEELLGTPEHDGTRSEPIKYREWDLYQQLERAQSDGTVASYMLGIGVDALTLAATILTVVVIEDDVFESVFGEAVQFNDEGEIVGIGDGRVTEGIPFTAESVDRMLDSEPLASPGAACLSLAWQHRQRLLP